MNLRQLSDSDLVFWIEHHDRKAHLAERLGNALDAREQMHLGDLCRDELQRRVKA